MLGWIALFLAGGPFLLALWNLRLYRVPPLEPLSAGGRRQGAEAISVLIPARNEAGNIRDAVACILANRGIEIDLVVLDDGSTDTTPDILRAIADPRLRVVDGIGLPPGWSGKQHACMALAKQARHNLLVFVDADVRLAPDALRRMANYMQSHDVGLASGFPRQRVVTWSEQLLIPLIHFLLLGYLPMALMQKSPAPGFGAGCGQLFIARRADYDRAGGHTAIRTSLHDGITLPRAFRRVGSMTGLFDATDLAECRMYDATGPLWEGLTKNATEGMATRLGLPVWTAVLAGGHVLPLVLVLFAPSWQAALAFVLSIGVRLILAERFQQPAVSALLHPVGILALLVVQWAALIRSLRGRPATWRGRAYPAP
jgi:hypothetical protein